MGRVCFCYFFMYGFIPPKLLAPKIMIIYIIGYTTIYYISQIIIWKKQIILSNCLYKTMGGQLLFLMAFPSYMCTVASYYRLYHRALFNIIFILLFSIIFLLSIIYFFLKKYNNTLKTLYSNELPNKMEFFNRLYRWIIEYGGLLIIERRILQWIFGEGFDDFRKEVCLILLPCWTILFIAMSISYLFEFVNAYYLVKYSEEYREHYGFTMTEWYGKYSKQAIAERRMKNKNRVN